MKKLKVGVKFCGHCNPIVDGPSLLTTTEMENAPVVFVSWAESGKDVLLIVSGCVTACRTLPDFNGPTIEVAGNSLNGIVFPADKLPGEIVKKLKEMVDPYGKADY